MGYSEKNLDYKKLQGKEPVSSTNKFQEKKGGGKPTT